MQQQRGRKFAQLGGFTQKNKSFPMTKLDDARATQLANIEKRTGKTLTELSKIVASSGLTKHGERVAMLKSTLSMGHGDANALVHYAVQSEAAKEIGDQNLAIPALAASATPEQALDGLYTGPKAGLRAIHDQLMHAIDKFGAFEAAPKKTYVSYRRKKQFAMIGPATNTRIELGLNVKSLPVSERLQELPAGQMCNFKVKISQIEEVNQELLDWIKAAYDAAG